LNVMYDGRTQQSQGQASGVIVDASGYIVTNYHVVADAARVFVHLADQQMSYPAERVGIDPKNDLAVLKINASNLTPAAWGDSDKIEVGDIVFAMGNPFGLDGTLTQGIVSAKGRRGVNERFPYQEYIQTDAAVNPGNSGGPLVNIQGQVIGINTAIVGPTYQGISFAIPSNVAREIYEQLKANQKVSNGYVGVGLSVLTEEAARKLNLPEPRGALIAAVGPGSPAEKAGLRQFDVIRKWNVHEIDDPRLLSYLITRTQVGTKIPVVIIREGKEMTLEVTVEERPEKKQ
jgi:serine protease Do